MCTGRVDLAFIFRALLKGKDGVFIGGCWPGECHYLTQGNLGAVATVHMGKKLLETIGVNPERLTLEFMSASEGSRYAEVMNSVAKTVKALGPLGRGEGMDEAVLKRKLEGVYQLIPYIKLVERERMRIPEKSAQAYNEFFTGEEFNRLFDALIGEKVETGQIMAILREQPRSAREVSNMLGLPPGEVSSRLKRSARQGFVEFDKSAMRFCAV